MSPKRSTSTAVDEESRSQRRRREFRVRLLGSLAMHVVVLVILAFAPAPKARPLPPVVTIDLLAAPRPARAASRPARATPPPAPVQKKIILPKNPAPLVKKPRKAVRPKPRPRPEELDYEDALAKLREDLGEQKPSEPVAEAAPDATVSADSGEGSGGEAKVSPELREWILGVVRHVRATFVTPPEFRDRGLRTCMTVFLTADGRVMGEPTVTRSSGDVYWDDNATRAILRASPLPPPIEAGDWPICFNSEERS